MSLYCLRQVDNCNYVRCVFEQHFLQENFYFHRNYWRIELPEKLIWKLLLSVHPYSIVESSVQRMMKYSERRQVNIAHMLHCDSQLPCGCIVSSRPMQGAVLYVIVEMLLIIDKGIISIHILPNKRGVSRVLNVDWSIQCPWPPNLYLRKQLIVAPTFFITERGRGVSLSVEYKISWFNTNWSLIRIGESRTTALFCLAYAPLIIDNLLTVFVCILLQRKMLWVSVCKTSCMNCQAGCWACLRRSWCSVTTLKNIFSPPMPGLILTAWLYWRSATLHSNTSS